MKTKVLVGLLADGEVHSGESLARQLGISRTAVWKQVRRALDQGIAIETIRGKGYRLKQAVDLLDAAEIIRLLLLEGRELGEPIALRVLDEIDSTNAEVMRQSRTGESAIPVCLADTQSAGRGRRGRAWQSPKGENLYISFGLRFAGGFSVLDGLSLVFGVVLAETLEEHGVSGVQLKWPNDVFHDGRKLAGILIELQGELEAGMVQVVTGMGLNVHMTAAPGIDQPWTSLAVAVPQRTWCRNAIAATLIRRVLEACDEFSQHGFEAFRERWAARDMFVGRRLVAVQGAVAGIGRSIAADGSYLIETGDGELTPVRAGEISLRVKT